MPTHFVLLNIFLKNFSETQKGSSTKCFGTVRWNHFDAQSWRPPFFLSLLFFDFKKIWNTERFSTKSFGTMRPKNRLRIVMPTHFLFLNIFRLKKISETQMGSSTKRLGTVRQKLSTENRETPPPPMHENFRLENFWNTKRFPYEIFRFWEPKKLTRIVMPAPFVYPNIFQNQKLSETQKGPLRNVSLLGSKHFRSTVVIPRPFLSSTFSPSGKMSETERGSLTYSFGIVKQNSLPENRDTPPLFMHEKFRC